MKFVAVAFAFLVVGCSSGETPVGKQESKEDKLAASEGNFSKVVSAHLEQNGDLCVGSFSFPEKVEGFGPEPVLAKELESIGLIKSEETPGKGKLYTITDEGKKYAVRFDGKVFGEITRFCWGKKKLIKVTKWDGPLKLGDYQEAKVYYSYQVEVLADWIKNPIFREESKLASNSEPQEADLDVKATSNGWEARENPLSFKKK